jgi:putative nucleotidyltransferase with HDIG domain
MQDTLPNGTSAALDSYPALVESRDRLLAAAGRDGSSAADIVAAIERDPALVMAVVRLANRSARHAGSIGSVAAAVDVLPSGTLAATARSIDTVDRFDPSGDWGALPDRFRLHALSVNGLVGRLGAVLGVDAVDELSVAAMLHDVGELALYATEPGFPADVADARSPEERCAAERDSLGIDHATLGAELLRAWQLPDRLADAIAGHHEAADGEAAILRLADALAYYSQGRPTDLGELIALARNLGLSRETLSDLLYELPSALAPPRAAQPCPLSERELEVLRRLADAKLPKEIAHELELSQSTVRNHLHRIYSRLGAADRTQAVLIARDRGWI